MKHGLKSGQSDLWPSQTTALRGDVPLPSPSCTPSPLCSLPATVLVTAGTAELKSRTYLSTSAGLRGYTNIIPLTARWARDDTISHEPLTIMKFVGSGRYLLTGGSERISTPSICRFVLSVVVVVVIVEGEDDDHRDSRRASRRPLPLPMDRTRPFSLTPTLLLNVFVMMSRSFVEMLRQQSGWCLGSSVILGRCIIIVR